MAFKVIPEDFTLRLARLQAELARRDGYGDLSSYATTTFPEGTPISVGGYITTPVFNTLIEGLTYINGTGLPDEAVANETYINSADLTAIDAALTAFEAQSRGAISGSDCASLCSGMCVTQCTTTCQLTCTGGCADSCSVSCTGNCTGACTSCTSCTGTCTGGCTSCTSCTGGCSSSCYTSCWAACRDNCSSTCGGTCSGTCSGGCTGGGYSTGG